MKSLPKPTLIFITNRLVIGGISNDLIPLAYYLKQDFEILILHGEKEKDEKESLFLLAQYPGIIIKKIPHFQKKIRLFKDLKALRSFYREIKKSGCKIVHTHGSKAGLMGRVAAKMAGIPQIIHTYHGHVFHSYYNPFFSKCIVSLERCLGYVTHQIIATSEHQRKEIVEHYKIVPEQKVAIIHLGIDENIFLKNITGTAKLFRNKFALADDMIGIGMVARIVQVKNMELFTTIVAKLVPHNSKKIKFFLIGDGALKGNVQKMLDERNIRWCETEDLDDNASVVFTSWIFDIATVLTGLDIIMLTSNNEGTALTLAEGQLCGKPVVATNVGGVRDTLIDNETGFLIPPGDADVFASKLQLLIENKCLRESMGKKAAIFARQRFSKKMEVEKLIKLYNKN